MTRSLAFALFTTTTAVAQAAPVDPVNDNRPVTIGVAPDTEQSLQAVLDGLFGLGKVSAVAGQSHFGMWTAATSSATTIPTLVAEYAANAAITRFGIWFGSDTGGLFTQDLLLGPAVVGSNSAIRIENGHLEIGSTSFSSCGVKVFCGDVYDSRITPASFGFYFGVEGQPNDYSVDHLNAGTVPRVLAFQDGATTNWALAYEDGSDLDYNDMVVKIESIAPIPEPRQWAMMLAGLGLMGALARRRRADP